MMWAPPLATALLCGFFAGVALKSRSRGADPSFVWWSIALAGVAIASACLFLGSFSGWTPFIARTWYLFGAVTLVAFFSVGMAYLLAPRPIAHIWAAVVVLAAFLSLFLLAGAPVDGEALTVAGEPGWKAVESPWLLSSLSSAMGSLGILVMLTGAVFAYVYRQFTFAAILLAAGAIVIHYGANIIAAFGGYELSSLGYLAGAFLIMAGVLRQAGGYPD
jgi:hypothetical protein